MRVVIIGAGNAATVLGRSIKIAGHDIIQVYSRHLLHAEDLADELECEPVNDWGKINGEGQLYLVALSDKAVENLSQNWTTNKGMVVHTAGALSKNVLQNVAANFGVLYPLQSLRKEKLDYDIFPLLTDGNTEDDRAFITDFAETLSTVVRHASDEYRMKIHVAAVVVNNFTNHLYSLAEDYCKTSKVNFDLLKPLIIETAERLKDFPPSLVQTGPAVRADEATIDKHMMLLENFPELKDIYFLLTQSIRSGLLQQ